MLNFEVHWKDEFEANLEEMYSGRDHFKMSIQWINKGQLFHFKTKNNFSSSFWNYEITLSFVFALNIAASLYSSFWEGSTLAF